MRKIIIVLMLTALAALWSCGDDPIPKPVGLFRIDIPEHGYKTLDTVALPYSFDYADYAKIINTNNEKPYWIDVYYPHFKAKIYITYFKMDTTLAKYIDDCHTMTYKHTSKATNIEKEVVVFPEHKVYGLIYYIEGSEAASPLNFYLTDSTERFARGALYFNLEPNNDSLQPVIESIEKDIKQMIKTFRWKPQQN